MKSRVPILLQQNQQNGYQSKVPSDGTKVFSGNSQVVFEARDLVGFGKNGNHTPKYIKYYLQIPVRFIKDALKSAKTNIISYQKRQIQSNQVADDIANPNKLSVLLQHIVFFTSKIDIVFVECKPETEQVALQQKSYKKV